MHDSVMGFVAGVVDDYGLAGLSTLEVGSYDVNGSVKGLFTGPYVGVDREAGPGVDQVCDAENLPFDDNTFQLVISTEALEHADRPWQVWREMARVVAPGGFVIATLRGFSENGSFPFHNAPDTTRLSERGLRVQVEDAGLTDIRITPDPQVIGHFVIARKPE